MAFNMHILFCCFCVTDLESHCIALFKDGLRSVFTASQYYIVLNHCLIGIHLYYFLSFDNSSISTMKNFVYVSFLPEYLWKTSLELEFMGQQVSRYVISLGLGKFLFIGVLFFISTSNM